MTTAVLCDRGQITIPKQFRTKLGFAPRMILSFRVSGNTLVVEKQKKRNPFEEARGCCSFPDGITSTDELVREMRGC